MVVRGVRRRRPIPILRGVSRCASLIDPANLLVKRAAGDEDTEVFAKWDEVARNIPVTKKDPAETAIIQNETFPRGTDEFPPSTKGRARHALRVHYVADIHLVSRPLARHGKVHKGGLDIRRSCEL